MSNHAILFRNNKTLIVQINPLAFKARLFKGKLESSMVCAFTTNYSWLGVPIGILKTEDKVHLSLKPAVTLSRPCLCIRKGIASIRDPQHPDFSIDDFSLVMQGGPTLVKNGKKDIRVSEEQFRADAVRKTDQVAVGTTKAGKIVVVVANASLNELADCLLEYKCLSGMKFDGGSMSSLVVRSGDEVIRAGQKALPKIGICFEIP